MIKISVHKIRSYAMHGCLPQENIIGGHYVTDVVINAHADEACLTDDLKETIDYCQIHDAVQDEMKITSKLIEHVAHRIAKKILIMNERVEGVTVIVTKINPPMNGDAASVSVEVSLQK